MYFYLANGKVAHILMCSLYDLQYYFDPLVVVGAKLHEEDENRIGSNTEILHIIPQRVTGQVDVKKSDGMLIP